MISLLLAIAVIGLALGLLFLVWKLRKIARKLGQTRKEMAKLNNEFQTALKNLEEKQWVAYRQSEIYAQLLNELSFTQAIPPTRSWAASPDLLMTLVTEVKARKPKLIVELGSGLSTLMMAKSLSAGSTTKIISFDHSAEFAQITRDLLVQHSITGVEIRVAPLEQYDAERTWYSRKFFADITQIDLLVIDGPPGSKDPKARTGALLELASKLSPKAVVIIDDANREGEHAMAESFAKAMPGHTLRFLPHEKGTAVISPS
jgi:predicted O-methyltransferase YrrM